LTILVKNGTNDKFALFPEDEARFILPTYNVAQLEEALLWQHVQRQFVWLSFNFRISFGTRFVHIKNEQCILLTLLT
jgi:CDP-diacylglycerol pyrophosphatase